MVLRSSWLKTMFCKMVVCTEKEIKVNRGLCVVQYVNKLYGLHVMILDTLVQKRLFKDCVQHIGFQI